MNVESHAHYRQLTAMLVVIVAAMFALAGSAVAQVAAVAPEDEDDYIAVLTADKVYVRSGAANSYYPFGMLREDALVKVLEEKYNWARVATIGPAFEDMFGYIKQAATENRVLRLNSDGTKGVTLGRVNLVAANLETGNSPQHSWKPIAHLKPDTELRVLKTLESDSQTIYAVALPAEASGWISMAHLRPADEAETRKWEQLTSPDVKQAAGEIKPPDQNTPPPANPVLARDEPTVAPSVTDAPVQQDAAQQSPARTAAADQQHASNQPRDGASTESETEAPTNQAPQQQPTVASDQPTERTNEQPKSPTPSPKEPAAEPVKGDTKTTAPRTPAERLAALEAAFERLREEPIETAEVDVLRQLYVDLAADAPDEKSASMYARSRAEQLRIWGELQIKRRELKWLRSQIDVASEDVQSVRYALQTSGSYDAVGRIAASTVYDGTQLPRLYRVQDPGTGRSIAYLRPHETFDLVGMLDQLVGIVGRKSYDGSLQLHIIDPERIDLLAPQPEQATGSNAAAGG